MVKDLYSLKDNKAGCFNTIIAESRKQEVIRSLRTTVNTAGSAINMYPEDFDLFKLGEVDIESGIIKPCNPEYIIGCYELVDRKSKVSREEIEELNK